MQRETRSSTHILTLQVVQYVLWANASDIDTHGTHVSGTIAGVAFQMDTIQQPSYATGVAPGAKLAVFNLGASVSVPVDPGVMYDIQRTVSMPHAPCIPLRMSFRGIRSLCRRPPSAALLQPTQRNGT